MYLRKYQNEFYQEVLIELEALSKTEENINRLWDGIKRQKFCS
jgi:hypothetical protein